MIKTKFFEYSGFRFLYNWKIIKKESYFLPIILPTNTKYTPINTTATLIIIIRNIVEKIAQAFTYVIL